MGTLPVKAKAGWSGKQSGDLALLRVGVFEYF
jgi:hypothetical protein